MILKSVFFRAFVYLNNLLHNLPLVHKVAVVNEKGNVRGFLRVCIEPILLNENNVDLSNDNARFNKGVRQSARLNFRREDFLKRYQQRAQASSCGRCGDSKTSPEKFKSLSETGIFYKNIKFFYNR